MAGAMIAAQNAAAHPHAFIEMKTKPLVQNGALTGFSMQWTLDEASSAEILYDLELAKDDKAAQQKLFDEMMQNVVREHYFSYFYDGQGNKIKYSSKPQNYGLRAAKYQLQYYFDFMLSAPQPLKSNRYVLTTYDPSYYIFMYYDVPLKERHSQTAVDFTALPVQCKGEIKQPNVDQKTQDYAASLDRTQRNDDLTLGAVFAQEVLIICE